MEEFELQKNTLNKVVIPCVHHKTGPKGRAKLVIDNEPDFSYLLDYKFLMRDHLIPNANCHHLFFLTHTGAKYTQVYRKLLEAIKLNDTSVNTPPPPNAHRVKVTTDIARTIKCDLTRRKVNKHLCHSDYTSEKF